MAGTAHKEAQLRIPAYETLSVPKLRSWQKGSISATWEIREGLQNAIGDLFGGYYGVLADFALSYSAMTVLGDDELFKTTGLRISYFRPAKEGTIEIEGAVVNRSRSFIHAETLFRNQEGKLIAKAEASIAVMPAGE